MGISNTSALAYVCEEEPHNCNHCKWQLNNCDNDGTPDFTTADVETNENNPCYPYCA